MIIGIDNIITWLETNQTPYWYVKDNAGTNLIFSAQSIDESLSLEDSKQKLEACLKTLAQGNYSIEAWQKQDQKKGWSKTKFQITSGSQSNTTPQINGTTTQAPQQDIGKLIEEALERERTKQKITQLETDIVVKDKKIKELETELDSIQIRIGKRFDQVFGGMFPVGEETPTSTVALGSAEDESERVAQLMERWATKDPDFTRVLEGIVNICYNNPTKYAMGKNLLK